MQPSDSSQKHMTHGAGAGMRTSYSGLFVSIAVSFVVMFGLMYSMADSASNVYFNLSNVYMTGLMAGSMLPVMLATMPGMFMDRRINLALWAISAAALLQNHSRRFRTSHPRIPLQPTLAVCVLDGIRFR